MSLPAPFGNHYLEECVRYFESVRIPRPFYSYSNVDFPRRISRCALFLCYNVGCRQSADRWRESCTVRGINLQFKHLLRRNIWHLIRVKIPGAGYLTVRDGSSSGHSKAILVLQLISMVLVSMVDRFTNVNLSDYIATRNRAGL